MPTLSQLRARPMVGLIGGAALVACLVLAPAPAGAADVVFTSDGTFAVPVGVTEITVTAVGASGGSCTDSTGGLGATVVATLTVTPGETLRVHVGGAGADCALTPGVLAGGANGGGASGPTEAGSGGGASDVRSADDALADRLVVAGGGGGSAETGQPENGGPGGHPDGGTGTGGCDGGGGGGTQTAGGAPGQYSGAASGALGVGGAGYSSGGGGGGGGGYYGGAGGGYYGSGGGGSSFVGSRVVGSATHAVAATAGAGSVTIDWTAPPPTTTTTAPPTTTTTVLAPSAGYGPEHSASLITTVEGEVRITGSGWLPGSVVDATVHSDPVHLGTLVADATGAIDATFTLPAPVPAGDHVVVLSGTATNGQPATIELVLGVTEAAPAEIAFTC